MEGHALAELEREPLSVVGHSPRLGQTRRWLHVLARITSGLNIAHLNVFCAGRPDGNGSVLEIDTVCPTTRVPPFFIAIGASVPLSVEIGVAAGEPRVVQAVAIPIDASPAPTPDEYVPTRNPFRAHPILSPDFTF
jgi:hypothetical protein